MTPTQPVSEPIGRPLILQPTVPRWLEKRDQCQGRATDPRFPYGSEAVFKNWLGAPLSSKGEIIGVLALEKREPNFYDVLHEQLALTFANQAAVVLIMRGCSMTRARASALDRAQRLALLNRCAGAGTDARFENITRLSCAKRRLR
jgi:signal transduction protein with GAF and PtsI domain